MKYLYAPPVEMSWSAVIGEQQIVFVDSSDGDVLATLWANRALGAQGAVETLSTHGLAATPAFALVEWMSDDDHPAGTRVIVRGAVNVTITTHAGSETVSGARVSTWGERHFDDVIDCTIAVDQSTANEFLPILAGVVRATRVDCTQEKTSVAVSPLSAAGPVSEATIVDRPSLVDDLPQSLVSASDAGPSAADDDTEGYDFLFGETVMRDVSAAANGNGDAESPADVSSLIPLTTDAIGAAPQFTEPATKVADIREPEGDHDGMTIMTGDLVNHRSSRPKPAADEAPVPDQPSLYLQLSTGARELLSQPILVGRAPTVSKVSSGALPRLVTIPGDKDISRNHVQIIVEGGTAVVTDLHSRNGTHVALPGRPSQRLRAGEPTAVIVGTIIDLGGDVTLTVGEES
ncbi:MAG: FHA domain-containing protein [Rhodoglobus sp.]